MALRFERHGVEIALQHTEGHHADRQEQEADPEGRDGDQRQPRKRSGRGGEQQHGAMGDGADAEHMHQPRTAERGGRNPDRGRAESQRENSPRP